MDDATYFRICAIEEELEYLRGKVLAMSTARSKREQQLAKLLWQPVTDSFIEGYMAAHELAE